MGKSYRAYLPEQDFLLPPSLREWLPENHLVYFVSDVVDNLNLSALDAVYGDEQRGQPPYATEPFNLMDHRKLSPRQIFDSDAPQLIASTLSRYSLWSGPRGSLLVDFSREGLDNGAFQFEGVREEGNTATLKDSAE